MQQEKMTHKKAVHTICLQQIEDSLHTLEKRLASIQESRNNETKSSVGDKYETGRSMMQMEENTIQLQKAKVLENKQALYTLVYDKLFDTIQAGSIVITNHLNFYVGVALGKIAYEGSFYYCISRKSPIGQQLYGKSKGEKLSFNGKQYRIIDVY